VFHSASAPQGFLGPSWWQILKPSWKAVMVNHVLVSDHSVWEMYGQVCTGLFVSLKQIWNDPPKFHGNIMLNENIIQPSLVSNSRAFLKSVYTSGTRGFYFFFYWLSERRICDQ
jgi:hypothetical protein